MLKKLRVQNFRKHKDFSVEFGSGPTVITGTNGSGKTSLLEAIYIALQGKSWRSNFVEILRDDTGKLADWWRIDLDFVGGDKYTVKFDQGVKTFEIGAQNFARLPAKFRKPVILFEPNDLQLLYGSPARRRDFFDRFVSQIEPAHGVNLRKFERILRQRNNLLKRGVLADELFVWDLQFADLAEKIITTRNHWTQEINKNLTNEYRKIAAGNDDITVKYMAPQKSRQQILSQLNRDFTENWPFTRSGPQTHDIKFTINGHDAKLSASRGENRTIIFAVLAAMAKIFNQLAGEKIYLLFDDIDSELDAERRGELCRSEIFTDNYLFATTIKTNRKSTDVIDLVGVIGK